MNDGARELNITQSSSWEDDAERKMDALGRELGDANAHPYGVTSEGGVSALWHKDTARKIEENREEAQGEVEGEQPLAAGLPAVILSSIFVLLDVRSLFSAAAVCRSWRSAALDPSAPHNTSLALVVATEAGVHGRSGPAAARAASAEERLRAAAAGDGARGRELEELAGAALSPDAAANVLAHAFCSRVRGLRLHFFGSGALFLNRALGPRRAALERLELRAPCHGPEDAARASLQLLLDLFAPRLRSLILTARGGAPARFGPGLWPPGRRHLPAPHPPLQLPEHPTLEELGADVDESFVGERERLPRLCRLHALSAGPARLVELAARPLAARSLELVPDPGGGDAPVAGLAEAVAAVLRADAFGGFPEAPPPLRLALFDCPPPAAWPKAALAGLEQLALFDCFLCPVHVQWLLWGPHVATLRSLELDCVLVDASPEAFVEGLEALPRGVRVALGPGMRLAAPDEADPTLGRDVRLWLPGERAGVYRRLAASPRLLADVSLEADPLPAAARRPPDGGSRRRACLRDPPWPDAAEEAARRRYLEAKAQLAAGAGRKAGRKKARTGDT